MEKRSAQVNMQLVLGDDLESSAPRLSAFGALHSYHPRRLHSGGRGAPQIEEEAPLRLVVIRSRRTGVVVHSSRPWTDMFSESEKRLSKAFQRKAYYFR